MSEEEVRKHAIFNLFFFSKELDLITASSQEQRLIVYGPLLIRSQKAFCRQSLLDYSVKVLIVNTCQMTKPLHSETTRNLCEN